jgi:hypothetical protein
MVAVPCFPAAVGASVPYNSSRGRSFMLNPTPANGSAAERTCRDQGGHLASFLSLAEQQEVEGYYLGRVGGTRAPQACWYQHDAPMTPVVPA